jgi:hypothetical protein
MEEQLQPEAQRVIEEVQNQGQEDAGSDDDDIPGPAVPEIPDEAIPFPGGPIDTTILRHVHYRVHEA